MKSIISVIAIATICFGSFTLEAQAATCSSAYTDLLNAQNRFIQELDEVSEANFVKASKNAIKACKSKASKAGDQTMVSFLTSGESICKRRNTQNSPAAAAACLSSLLEVVPELTL